MPIINTKQGTIGATQEELVEIEKCLKGFNCEDEAATPIPKVSKVTETIDEYDRWQEAREEMKNQYLKQESVQKINKSISIQFVPGHRVNLTDFCKNSFSIFDPMFINGAIILDIHSNYLPGGQIERTFRLEECYPISGNPEYKPKAQYLEFQVLDEQIHLYLEPWDNIKINNKTNENNKVIWVKGKQNTYQSRGYKGYSKNINCYDDYLTSDYNELGVSYDEQVYLEKKKIIEQAEKIRNSWGKKEMKPRGHSHPLTKQFV